LNKRAEAKKFYQLYADENKESKSLESLILLNFLEKNWKEMERLLLVSINQFNDNSAYASLISLYDKYLKDEKKKAEALQKIEQIEMSDELRNIILTTHYLKQKNTEKASSYCEKLNPESEETFWRKLALFVLKDEKEKAQGTLDLILTRNPRDKDALMLKGVLGF
jgi:tetratricopeptide (TPR) repeat protein